MFLFKPNGIFILILLLIKIKNSEQVVDDKGLSETENGGEIEKNNEKEFKIYIKKAIVEEGNSSKDKKIKKKKNKNKESNQRTSSSAPQTQNSFTTGVFVPRSSSTNRRSFTNRRNHSRQNTQVRHHQHSQHFNHPIPPVQLLVPHPILLNQHQYRYGTGGFYPDISIYSTVNNRNRSQSIHRQPTIPPIQLPGPPIFNHHQNLPIYNVQHHPSISQPISPFNYQLGQNSGIRSQSRLNPYAEEYIPLKYRIFNNHHFGPYQTENSALHQNTRNGRKIIFLKRLNQKRVPETFPRRVITRNSKPENYYPKLVTVF
uniref:Uncharacterized protein n=1 Tax=Meloidogyne hapla TaxID=6305 RepID=A0A1I8BB26_MELHA